MKKELLLIIMIITNYSKNLKYMYKLFLNTCNNNNKLAVISINLYQKYLFIRNYEYVIFKMKML